MIPLAEAAELKDRPRETQQSIDHVQFEICESTRVSERLWRLKSQEQIWGIFQISK